MPHSYNRAQLHASSVVESSFQDNSGQTNNWCVCWAPWLQIIPGANNTNNLAYATGVFNGGLYLVNPTDGTAKEVINFGVDAHPHLLAPANQQVGGRYD
jgi:hypothetical protein